MVLSCCVSSPPDFVPIGPRFSNLVLQALLVLLRKLPPTVSCCIPPSYPSLPPSLSLFLTTPHVLSFRLSLSSSLPPLLRSLPSDWEGASQAPHHRYHQVQLPGTQRHRTGWSLQHCSQCSTPAERVRRHVSCQGNTCLCLRAQAFNVHVHVCSCTGICTCTVHVYIPIQCSSVFL